MVAERGPGLLGYLSAQVGVRGECLRTGVGVRVLFAVSSWGLGHATRSLPLIERLLAEKCRVTVISTERALAVLRQELADRCEFLDWPDIPKPLARSAPLFYAKFALSVPLLFRSILDEHRALKELLRVRQFDCIISDSRYGIYSPKVESYFLSHGLRLILPNRNPSLELAMEYFNARWFSGVKKILVPDFAEPALSGELSHNLTFFERERVEYIGILSRLRQRPVERDLDYFITISGPEPQRTLLERLILSQVERLPGRVVVALGRPEEPRRLQQGRVEVYGYLDREQQELMMNRSRLVIARSGYSTLMELVELDQRALLIPTPGQTEQMYLSRYHRALGTYYSVEQEALNLPVDVQEAARYPGFRAPFKTAQSVENFVRVVLHGQPVDVS